MDQAEIESTVRRLVIAKVSRDRISKRVGLTLAELEEMIRRLWAGARSRSLPVDPTPEEIAERCREIRERWSEWDYRVRSGQHAEPSEPQRVTWKVDRFETA